ncbi:MAG: hypothetical protein ABFD18_19255 [Syntrophomonas sp.]
MEKVILMGNFIFCPMQQMPRLGNECQECQFLSKTEENYYCVCELGEEEQTSAGEFDLKELINIMIDLLYKGQTSLKKEELIKILDQDRKQ